MACRFRSQSGRLLCYASARTAPASVRGLGPPPLLMGRPSPLLMGRSLPWWGGCGIVVCGAFAGFRRRHAVCKPAPMLTLRAISSARLCAAH